MKRLMLIFAVVLVLAVPAFALSEEQYLALKTFRGFAAADEKLTRAYNEAEKVMDKSEFDALSESQRAWIAEQRDVSAGTFSSENYGEQAVLTFQDTDTISVKANDAFKDAFDPDGTYTKVCRK